MDVLVDLSLFTLHGHKAYLVGTDIRYIFSNKNQTADNAQTKWFCGLIFEPEKTRHQGFRQGSTQPVK